MSRVGLLLILVLCQFANVIASIWMLLAIIGGSPRALRIALGYDHLGNAVTGGNPGETISSRAYRAMTERRRWGCVLCRLLDFIDKDHYKKAVE